jgi:hypothetical protein
VAEPDSLEVIDRLDVRVGGDENRVDLGDTGPELREFLALAVVLREVVVLQQADVVLAGRQCVDEPAVGGDLRVERDPFVGPKALIGARQQVHDVEVALGCEQVDAWTAFLALVATATHTAGEADRCGGSNTCCCFRERTSTDTAISHYTLTVVVGIIILLVRFAHNIYWDVNYIVSSLSKTLYLIR